MYFSDFKLEAINTDKRFSNFGFPYVIAPAFSTPAIYSRIFHFCIFHSRIFSAPISSRMKASLQRSQSSTIISLLCVLRVQTVFTTNHVHPDDLDLDVTLKTGQVNFCECLCTVP